MAPDNVIRAEIESAIVRVMPNVQIAAPGTKKLIQELFTTYKYLLLREESQRAPSKESCLPESIL